MRPEETEGVDFDIETRNPLEPPGVRINKGGEGSRAGLRLHSEPCFMQCLGPFCFPSLAHLESPNPSLLGI